jgi:hypothetical protein
MAMAISDEHTLEFLLAFNGRTHRFEQGYWLKFEFKRVEKTPKRPHGLRYSLTLHGPDGNRLMGFDNAHGVPPLASGYSRNDVKHDHWHRTSKDAGRPYAFTTADQLLADFFAQVRRILDERGISDTVVRTCDEGNERNEP